MINLTVSTLFIIIVLWRRRMPAVVLRIDIENSSKILYCNNSFDNIVIICILIIVQSASFIQAFRCRKLPRHLNEAMTIVYASFIVTTSCCVMFPVYLFQQFEEDGEIVQAFLLVGNNLVLFFFLYCKKIFIIIFRPQKNTTRYFRMKQLNSIQKQAKKICK